MRRPALSLFAEGAVVVYEYTWCFGIALAFPFEHCKYKFDFTLFGVKRHSAHHSEPSVSFEKHLHSRVGYLIIDFNKPASICRLKRVLIYSNVFLITISMNVGCLVQGLTSIRIYSYYHIGEKPVLRSHMYHYPLQSPKIVKILK